MSPVVLPEALPTDLPAPRKRTSSFSFPATSASPRPTKAQRTSTASTTATGDMSSLRRTQSLLALPAFEPQSALNQPATPAVPYNRTLRYYKEQRDRQKALNRSSNSPITLRTRLEVTHSSPSSSSSRSSSTSPPSAAVRRSSRTSSATSSKSKAAQPHIHLKPQPSTSAPAPHLPSHRTTSPLSPHPTIIKSNRPNFPRSKAEPDLYRKALITRMMGTPEGQKIMHMGARLAVSIMTATRELEKIVAAQSMMECDMTTTTSSPSPGGDVVMMDLATSAPSHHHWGTLPTKEDWEMVDCAA